MGSGTAPQDGAKVVNKFKQVAEDWIEHAWMLRDVHVISVMIGVFAACYGDL